MHDVYYLTLSLGEKRIAHVKKIASIGIISCPELLGFLPPQKRQHTAVK